MASKLQSDALTRQKLTAEIAALPGAAARTLAQTTASNVAAARSRQEFEGHALRDLGVNPSDDNIRALGQDAVIKGIYTQSEADQKVNQFLAIPLANRAAQFKQYGAPAAAPEATSQEIRTMQALGYPNTPAGYISFREAQRPDKIPAPPSMVAEYTFAKTPDGGGFRGSFQDFVTARAAAARPLAQPPAPSTQTIADPTDPTKAIVIDTRRYIPGGGPNSTGVFGYAPPAKTAENIREEELKTAYNTNRILNSAVQIGKILKKTPSAAQPGGLEASATAMFGNAGVANLVRSEDRQIVAAAQSDIIDSLLYLATGAAYNKEQLAQQRQSYLPAFTDEPGTVVAKQDALRGLIDGAKVRSGRAWTPKMQSAVDLLTGGATTPAAAPAPSPSKPTTAISVTTPDGKTYSFVTPEQAAAFKKAAEIP